jgi:hypothetical protein
MKELICEIMFSFWGTLVFHAKKCFTYTILAYKDQNLGWTKWYLHNVFVWIIVSNNFLILCLIEFQLLSSLNQRLLSVTPPPNLEMNANVSFTPSKTNLLQCYNIQVAVLQVTVVQLTIHKFLILQTLLAQPQSKCLLLFHIFEYGVRQSCKSRTTNSIGSVIGTVYTSGD